MMRSLWAGVTGLQAHQIAMDVEGNNISNVNTTGFKYSRVNFANLLSQTSKIATAPQGELGGKNPMQIGLGTQVTSITTIYKQGSVQTTDKNTDLAIQGDGFFVVSPDGGQTYKYTRNGDFTFDAIGNFTDSNGYIIQGWMRDEETSEIDSTAPIRNITIPPGLTTPANDTTYIALKANLNSGNTVVNKKTIYALDSYGSWYDKNIDTVRQSTEVNRENDGSSDMFNTDKRLTDRGLDMGVLFNATGEAFNLRNGQGVWVSYAQAKTQAFAVAAAGETLDINLNGINITGATSGSDANINANTVANIINQYTNQTGVVASVQDGNKVVLTNSNNLGTEGRMKNIKLENNGDIFDDTQSITAYQYTYNSNAVTTSHDYNDQIAREFNTTEDLRAAMQRDARDYVNYTGAAVDVTDPLADWAIFQANNYNPGATVAVNSEGQFQINNVQNDTAFDARLKTGTDNAEDYTAFLANSDVIFPQGTTMEAGVTIENTSTDPIQFNVDGGTPITIPAGATSTIPAGGHTLSTNVHFSPGNSFGPAAGVQQIDVGTQGIIYNGNGGTGAEHNMFLTISELTNGSNDISANSRFTTSFSALQGALVTGTSMRTTQNIYAANHASSIDIYDSLGSKHTVRFEFTKTGYTDSGGTEWSMLISVPEPGEINFSGTGLDNIVTGNISFNSDGSLATFTPTSITYTANNGSTPNQNILLNFGTLGQFDGMTSFDQQSNTSGISQDGFPGGDLAGIRVDETGTLIGSFTNGRSFGLAQVSMAKFTNNEGLESDGGNTFIQTSNSGDPIIGQANIGGRGFIQASSLEMSNVDLSRSLTQLIIVQRGYQANSKTITTSDQMLETLLQLKR